MKDMAKDFLPPVLLRAWHGRGKKNFQQTSLSKEYYEKHSRLNADLPLNEIVLRPGLKLKVCPESRQSFEYFCFVEPDMVEEFDLFLSQTQGRKRLLDVGALHGIFSLAFTVRDKEATALAVEPSPKAAPFLLYNLRANPACAVEFVEVALSDCSGQVPMDFQWQHLKVAREGEGVLIDARRGDDLCREKGFVPDVIKIDIEGFELHCLRGLAETMTRSRPLVFLELHPNIKDYGGSLGDLVALCHDRKYHVVSSHNQRLRDEDVLGFGDDIVRILLRPNEA